MSETLVCHVKMDICTRQIEISNTSFAAKYD